MLSVQSVPDKKKYLIPVLILLLILLVAGLFLKYKAEDEAVLRVRKDLELYSQVMRLESAEVEVSLLSSTISIKNLVYTLNKQPITIKIGSLIQKGVDWSTLLGKPGDVTRIDKTFMENLDVLLADQPAPLIHWGYYETNNTVYSYRDIRAILQKHQESDDWRALFVELFPFLNQFGSGPDRARNIAMSYVQDQHEFRVEIEEVSSSGLDRLTGDKAGDMMIRNARLSNVTFNYANSRRSDQNLSISLEEQTLRGYTIHYKALQDAVLSLLKQERNDVAQFLGFLSLIYDYSLDQSTFKNLRGSFQNMTLILEQMETNNYTMKEQGPCHLRNLRINRNNLEIFHLEEAGMDKWVNSDRLLEILKNSFALVLNNSFPTMEGEGYYAVLKGSRLENLYLKNLRLPQWSSQRAEALISLAHWRGDMDLGEKANFKFQMRDFFLHRESLFMISSFVGAALEAAVPENKTGLSLDSDFNLDMRINDTLEFTLTFSLSENNLGAFQFALDALAHKQRHRTFGSPLLRKMEILFEDKGFLDALCNFLMGMDSDFGSKEAARQELLNGLDNLLRHRSDSQRVASLRAFVAEGGSLQIVLNPGQPVDVDNLSHLFMSNPQVLGLSITHNPAVTP